MRADIRGRTGVYYIYPHCPSALSDNVNGQGGQSVRFLQNNAFSNAKLDSDCSLTTSESSGLIVLCQGKIQKIGGKNMKLNELHHKLMESMSGKEREDFEKGLKALDMDSPTDREALRESIKRYRPDWTDAQLDTFVNPEASPKNTDWIV